MTNYEGPKDNFEYALWTMGIPMITLSGPECDGLHCDDYEHSYDCSLYGAYIDGPIVLDAD